MNMSRKRRGSIELGIYDERVAPGDHIAYFWETEEEFAKAVHFLEVGIRAADGIVVFGHKEANKKVVKTLNARGINCRRLQREGRLAVISGKPTGAATLAGIGETFEKLTASGGRLIRLLGNIGWGKAGWPKENDILEFEANVTNAAKQYPCVVVCMYDVKLLSGRIMVHGALETHPLTVCGNTMRENPYFVPVPEFLSKLKKIF